MTRTPLSRSKGQIKGQLVADVLNSQHAGTGATWRINAKILQGRRHIVSPHAHLVCCQNSQWLEPAPCCCCWAGASRAAFKAQLARSAPVACRNPPPPLVWYFTRRLPIIVQDKKKEPPPVAYSCTFSILYAYRLLFRVCAYHVILPWTPVIFWHNISSLAIPDEQF